MCGMVLWTEAVVSPVVAGAPMETMRGSAAVRKGTKHTAETRARMSAAHRGRRPMAGKRHTEEAKAKIGAAHKGRPKPRKKPPTPEHRPPIPAAPPRPTP